MPGRRMPSGLGTTIRKMTDPVVGSTVTSRNLSDPSCGYAVPSSRMILTLSVPLSLRRPLARLRLQSIQFHGGLRHVHVDGVELLNGRQGHRLIRRDDGAFGHVGPADAAGNGGGDLGVSQIDLGRLQRRFRLLDGRLGRLHRLPVAFHLRLGGPQRGVGHIDLGRGLVALHGGDGTGLEQVLVPLEVRLGEFQDGLMPLEAGDARVQRGPRPVGRLLRGGEVRGGIVVRPLDKGQGRSDREPRRPSRQNLP